MLFFYLNANEGCCWLHVWVSPWGWKIRRGWGWETFYPRRQVWGWGRALGGCRGDGDGSPIPTRVIPIARLNHRCQYVMPSCFSYIFHPPMMRLPYIKVVFISIMHQWVLKRKFYSFFLWVWLDKAKSKKRKEADDGGPLHKRSISTDSPGTVCAVEVPSLISPTPPSQVLALTWQRAILLHVAYGV